MNMEPSQWSNLPRDILLLVIKRLKETDDLNRVRAVCSTWYSSLPMVPNQLSSNQQLLFPLQVPPPLLWDEFFDEGLFNFYIVERIIYVIMPLEENPSMSPKAWLIKVEETSPKKLSIFNPLTGIKFNFKKGGRFPDKLNIWDYRVTQITRFYSVTWSVPTEKELHRSSVDEVDKYLGIRKVVTFRVSTSTEEVVTSVMMLRRDGVIGLWKSGYKWWKFLETNVILDIICFKDKFYAVDHASNITVIDPLSLTVLNFQRSITFCSSINPTFLVESKGHIYLVTISSYYSKYDQVLVWVLNEEVGELHWSRSLPTLLDDNVFFLGTDVSYSVQAKDLGWSRGNYIYYGGLFLPLIRVTQKPEWSKLIVKETKETDEGEEEMMSYEKYAGICDCEAVAGFKRIKDCEYEYIQHDLIRLGSFRLPSVGGTHLFWPPPSWVTPDLSCIDTHIFWDG